MVVSLANISLLIFIVTCGQTVGELPADVATEIKAIFNHNLQLSGQCPPPQETDVSFLLYTRSNRDIPITLDQSNPTQIDSTKPFILLIHGWRSSPTGYGLPQLKNAYLNRYDCNVIMLDWSDMASQLYTTCYCNIPNIAAIGANLLCLLSKEFDISTVHVVSHSLGAHLAGYIGQYTQKQCGKIERITGLDPSGPLYASVSNTHRLDKSDAIFVDVIHTDELNMGYLGNIESVDFHVNCGKAQPGCPTFNVTNIENTLLSTVFCSTLRSLDYMTESVNSDNFIAKSCNGCPGKCSADLLGTFTIMGEDCSALALSTKYWIPTNGSPPYARGCTPYLLGCLI